MNYNLSPLLIVVLAQIVLFTISTFKFIQLEIVRKKHYPKKFNDYFSEHSLIWFYFTYLSGLLISSLFLIGSMIIISEFNKELKLLTNLS